MADDERLDAIFADLRATFVRPVDDEVADRHLEAIYAAVSAQEVPVLADHPRRRVKGVVAAVAAGVVLVGGGVAAASGSLPAPVQGLVAAVAEPFGVELRPPTIRPKASRPRAPGLP